MPITPAKPRHGTASTVWRMIGILALAILVAALLTLLRAAVRHDGFDWVEIVALLLVFGPLIAVLFRSLR